MFDKLIINIKFLNITELIVNLSGSITIHDYKSFLWPGSTINRGYKPSLWLGLITNHGNKLPYGRGQPQNAAKNYHMARVNQNRGYNHPYGRGQSQTAAINRTYGRGQLQTAAINHTKLLNNGKAYSHSL